MNQAGKPPMPTPPHDPTPIPEPGPDLPPQPSPGPLPLITPELAPAAQRALAEAAERRAKARTVERPRELGGRDGPEPVRYGDWEKKGIAVDF
ncbi:MAG: DUF1674 domain-containing protein [Sulfitobacter sp.]|nr:DUF1674 domain-containing protein [Roseobacter sp.]PHR03943.1 MAG: DUF1674 domain-containing protein [Sulfitobacter sp.]|tara:strand:- start:6247 stop:6525 length:279 start_codon:yes stop_codon:yes gene_type:complete